MGRAIRLLLHIVYCSLYLCLLFSLSVSGQIRGLAHFVYELTMSFFEKFTSIDFDLNGCLATQRKGSRDMPTAVTRFARQAVKELVDMDPHGFIRANAANPAGASLITFSYLPTDKQNNDGLVHSVRARVNLVNYDTNALAEAALQLCGVAKAPVYLLMGTHQQVRVTPDQFTRYEKRTDTLNSHRALKEVREAIGSAQKRLLVNMVQQIFKGPNKPA